METIALRDNRLSRKEFIGGGLAAMLSAGCVCPSAAARPRWYKGMLHAHTYWSDGRCLPDVAVAAYRDAGYDFITLSDHNRFGTDPDRWMPVDPDFGGWPAKAVEPAQFERYRRDFPNGDWRVRNGRTEVRIRTWKELCAAYGRPGRFLLLPGVEITSYTGRADEDYLNLHMNYVGLEGVIERATGKELNEFVGGTDVAGLIRDNLTQVRRLAATQGNPPHVVMVNHPHSRYFDVRPADILANPEVGFFEVCNNGSDQAPVAELANDGWENDRFWDAVLAGRCNRGERLLYALASDDTHYYPNSGTAYAPINFADGYIRVRARDLSAAALFEAMARGDFYASCGVDLDDVSFADGRLSVRVPAKTGVRFTVRFIVTRCGVPCDPVGTVKVRATGEEMPFEREVPVYDPRVGETAAIVSGRIGEPLSASYELRQDDLYVRARIESDEPSPFPRPSRMHPRVKCAWTQPYGLRGLKIS